MGTVVRKEGMQTTFPQSNFQPKFPKTFIKYHASLLHMLQLNEYARELQKNAFWDTLYLALLGKMDKC